MVSSILKRIIGRTDSRGESTATFTVPGALHTGARILFIDSDDITDLLFVMPFIARVRAEVSGVQLGLLCDERTSHLALSCEQFQDVLVYDPEQLRPHSQLQKNLFQMLAEEPWDLAILIGREPDPLRDELAYASGAILRLGPGHPDAYPHLNCEVRTGIECHYPYNRTTTWGRLLGIALEDVPLRWPLPEKRLRQTAQLVHFNKPRKDQLLLGFDPGVGKEGTVLAAENLAFLANHLTSSIPSKSMVLSADEDPERTQALSRRLRGERLDLPRPTLLERILQLAQCDLFVSGNTDLFHFAAAMRVPSLGIFTPPDLPDWIPSQAERVEIIASRPGEELSLSEMMEKVDRLLG